MVFVDYHSGQEEKAEESISRMMTRSQSKRLAEEMAASKYKIDTPAAEQIIAEAQEKQEAWERRQKI